MLRKQRTEPRRSAGVAAVELALTITPMLIMALGVAEFGRMMFTFNALNKSVRDAARFMVAPPPTVADPIQAARNLAVYGSLTNTGYPLAPGLAATPAMVVVCTPDTCPADHQNQPVAGGGTIDLVSIRITGYVYNSIVTYVAPATLNFSDIAVTMRRNL